MTTWAGVALALALLTSPALAREADAALACTGEVWREGLPLEQPKSRVTIEILHSRSQIMVEIEDAPIEVIERLQRRLGLRISSTAISFADRAGIVTGSISMTRGTGIIVSKPWMVTLECALGQETL